jgi:hypothetical protein
MHKPNSIFEAAQRILLGEAAEVSDDEAVIKSVKKAFPAGAKIDSWSKNLEWSKRGGYAGEKSIQSSRVKLKALGFKYSDGKVAGMPDGSTSGFKTILLNKKLGWYVIEVMFYGQTASSNSYSLTLKKLEK